MSCNNSVIFPTINFSRSPSEQDLVSLTSMEEGHNIMYYNTDRKPSFLPPYQDYEQITNILPLLTPPATDNVYYNESWLKRQSYMCDPYCCYSYDHSCCSYGNSSDSIASCYSPSCHECNMLSPSTESNSLMDPNSLNNYLNFKQSNYFPYNSDLQSCNNSSTSMATLSTNNSRKLRNYSRPKRQSSIDTTSSESSDNNKSYATTASRRYPCPICKKRFTRPSSLATHMHSHTGEKPYECEHEGCGRRFSVVSNLRRHAKIHSHHS